MQLAAVAARLGSHAGLCGAAPAKQDGLNDGSSQDEVLAAMGALVSYLERCTTAEQLNALDSITLRIERALTGLTDPTTSTLSRGSSDSEKDEEDQNIIRLTSAVERLETACASMVLPEEGVLIS